MKIEHLPLLLALTTTALQPAQPLTVDVTGENLHLTATAQPGTTTVKTTTLPGKTLTQIDVNIDGTHTQLHLQPWTQPPIVAQTTGSPPVSGPGTAQLHGPRPRVTLRATHEDGSIRATLTYTGPDGTAQVLIDETLDIPQGPVRTALTTLAASVPFTPATHTRLTVTLYTAPDVTITLEYNGHTTRASDGNTATTTLEYTPGTPITVTLTTDGKTYTYTLTATPGTTGTGPTLGITLQGKEGPPHTVYELGGNYTPTGDPTTYGLEAEASIVWTVRTKEGTAPVGILLRAEWRNTGVPPTTLAVPAITLSEATLLKFCDETIREEGPPALAVIAPSLAAAVLHGDLPILGTGLPDPHLAATTALEPLIRAWIINRIADALSPILPPYLTGALLATAASTITDDPTAPSAILGALDAVLPVPLAAVIDAASRALTEPLSSITTVYLASTILAALWYTITPPLTPLALPAALWILESSYDTMTVKPTTTVTVAATGGTHPRPTSHS